jgi:aspartate/methionine/tyrosine aminotransferase
MQTNRLSLLLAEKRRAGVAIRDLTESNPTRAGIRYPEGFLAALADDRALLYEPEPFGLPAARECIAREYGVPFDCVAMTASTSEAYSWIFKLLCDPGDEVLVPTPSYPLFEYLARLESVAVRSYGLFYDHGWFIDFHTLERALNDKTRAIVLVNPNNPTGHFIRRHELDLMLEICARHDLALISDEVFADYPIDPAPDSVLTLRGVADFALNGLSKLVGLPQMKLGWIVMKQPVPELEMIADTYLSVSTPVQVALPELLGLRTPVQGQILGRLRANTPGNVEAGWYAVLPALDDEETAYALLRDENILVQPGYFYDFESSNRIVVSLLTPAQVFRDARDRILLRTRAERSGPPSDP